MKKGKRFIREILPFLVIFALAPWTLNYAYGAAGDVPEDNPVQIQVAEDSAMPGWQAYGKAIGGIGTPGDLFYFDVTERGGDITASLCIVNTQQLFHCYRYLTLRVGVYVQNSTGDWERASCMNGEPLPETYLTLRTGQVSFMLPGGAKYKLTIDGGSFYCRGTNVYGGSTSPRFNLTVD